MSRPVGTHPELVLAEALRDQRLDFRTHERSLPGTPDIVFPDVRLAVFVHGCYWHRHHRCAGARTPRSNTIDWLGQFQAIVSRDQDVMRRLQGLGWWVFVLWECEIVNDAPSAATRILRAHSARLAEAA